MKCAYLFLIITIISLPVSLKAQWKRETGFSFGFTSPSYNKSSFSYGTPGIMLKVGTYQSWFQPDKRLTVRPEIGLSTDIFSFDYEDGGKATYSVHKGNIIAFNGGMAIMAQLKIFPGTTIAIGPSGKFLVTEIANASYEFDGGVLWPDLHYQSETNGFSRKYLNHPSIGIKVLLLQKNLNGKIKMGIIVDRQWKKEEEAYFHFSRTTEISIYLSLL